MYKLSNHKATCITHMLYKEGINLYTHSSLVPSNHIYNSISNIIHMLKTHEALWLEIVSC